MHRSCSAAGCSIVGSPRRTHRVVQHTAATQPHNGQRRFVAPGLRGLSEKIRTLFSRPASVPDTLHRSAQVDIANGFVLGLAVHHASR